MPAPTRSSRIPPTSVAIAFEQMRRGAGLERRVLGERKYFLADVLDLNVLIALLSINSFSLKLNQNVTNMIAKISYTSINHYTCIFIQLISIFMKCIKKI